MPSDGLGDEVAHSLLEGVGRAALLRDYCFGIKPGQSNVMFDPVYPHHRAPRECPFCGQVYRIHSGWADHRDRCEGGPNPGANPAGVVDDRGTMHPTVRQLQLMGLLVLMLALGTIAIEVIA